MKLTREQRRDLAFILRNGPGTLPETKSGRIRSAVVGLLERGLLEKLNKLRPGPPMYEITPAGRAALQSQEPTDV